MLSGPVPELLDSFVPDRAHASHSGGFQKKPTVFVLIVEAKPPSEATVSNRISTVFATTTGPQPDASREFAIRGHLKI